MIALKQVSWPECRTYLATVGKKEITLSRDDLFNTDDTVVTKSPYDSNDIYYVLFDDAKPVAFANISVGDNIWIGDFQVVNSRKDQGLGTTFVNKLKEIYKDKVFQCNYLGMMARIFWNKQGFVRIGESTPKHVSRLLEYDPKKSNI